MDYESYLQNNRSLGLLEFSVVIIVIVIIIIIAILASYH